MALPFNVGELAQRARRLLSVRGKMPLDVDERVELNVSVMDAGVAPWRADGAEFSQEMVGSAAAANFSSMDFSVNAASNQGNTLRAVFRRFVFSNRNAVAVTYKWILAANSAVTSNGVWQTERTLPSALPTFGALRTTFNQQVASQMGSSFNLGGVSLAAGANVVVPVTIVLPAGYHLVLECQPVNTELYCMVEGELWNGEGFALS